MSQTTYDIALATGVAGDLFSDWRLASTHSKVVPFGDADIPAGRMVQRKSTDSDCELFDNSTVKLGVILRNKAEEGIPVEDGDMCSIVDQGKVWVPVDATVTVADPVYVRFAVEPEVFTLSFDIDFVALNSISGTLDGTAFGPVVYATSHANTLTLLAAALSATGLATAVVTGAREITLTGATNGNEMATGSTVTVTLGAAQAIGTYANVTGPTASADLGVFRDDADDVGNGATAVLLANAKFLKGATAGGVALLDLNMK